MRLISDGRAAVILFFVLSGYVLSLSCWPGKSLPYGWYLLRRFCRIYLPFAAAAVLSIVFAYWFRNFRPPLTTWFAQSWHTPITPAIVVRQLLMVPMFDFNTAFWSLTYEMQMSIVMPLLCLAMARTHTALFTLVLGVLVFASPFYGHTVPEYPGLSCQVVFLFVLGATLARYACFLQKICDHLGNWLWLVLAVSCLLYYIDIPPFVWQHARLAAFLNPRIFPVTGLGAAGILLCSLHLAPLARVLKHSLPEYLGRISYSLYLTHAVVLFALFDLLIGHLRGRWLLGLIAVAAWGCAHLFCISVEEPSMRLGKWLSARATTHRPGAATGRE